MGAVVVIFCLVTGMSSGCAGAPPPPTLPSGQPVTAMGVMGQNQHDDGGASSAVGDAGSSTTVDVSSLGTGSSDDEYVRGYANSEGISVADARVRISQEAEINQALVEAGIAPDSATVDSWIEATADGVVLHVRTSVVVRVPSLSDAMNADGISVVIDAVPAFVAARTAIASSKAKELISRIPGLMGFYVDDATGDLVLDVYDAAEHTGSERTTWMNDMSGIAAAITGLASVTDPLASPVTADATVNGGVAWYPTAYLCTAGFAGTYTSGATTYQGFFTAAHCGSTVKYLYQTAADYTKPSNTGTVKSVMWNANGDIEFVALASGDTMAKAFFGVSDSTPTAQGAISNPAVGTKICHRGVNTGYQCGTIQTTSYTPTYTNACNAPNTATVICNAVFGKVGYNRAEYDSGGPVFYGTQPVGIHIAGQDSPQFGVYSKLTTLPNGTKLM